MKFLLIPVACFFMFFTCNKKDTTPTATRHAIGDTAFGGIIFYFSDSAHEHGMAMAPANQSTYTTCWDPSQLPNPNNGVNPPICGASGTAIGTGAANTDKIIATLGLGNNAASECRNYSGGGFRDWYLPSKDELNILIINRAFFKLTDAWYWSSSEVVKSNGGSAVWVPEAYATTWSNNIGKYSKNTVRAVRSF